MAEFDPEDYADDPIIQYANRVQKLMTICTEVMHDGSPLTVRVEWLKALVQNFPPTGQDELKAEYQKLKAYSGNVGVFKTYSEIEDIYTKAHTWFYVHILQDLNKARPLFRRKGSLGEGERYSDKKENSGGKESGGKKGLGEHKDA